MKRKRNLGVITAGIVLIFALLLASCSQGGGVEYKKINPEKALELMEMDSAIVLDVRTPSEYAAAHIENAVLLPDYEIFAKANQILHDKSATILVYCRSGNRSASAAKKLIEMGYENVYDFGGIETDWPYETVK